MVLNRSVSTFLPKYQLQYLHTGSNKKERLLPKAVSLFTIASQGVATGIAFLNFGRGNNKLTMSEDEMLLIFLRSP